MVYIVEEQLEFEFMKKEPDPIILHPKPRKQERYYAYMLRRMREENENK